MAKKIKFALEMKDGAKVRTLEELQEHVDMEKIVGYFLDGKLIRWLEDRYYVEKVEALRKLETNNPDISAICKILDIPYTETSELDIASIQKKNKKLDMLKQLTDDEDLLFNSSRVAFSQSELEALVAQGEHKIYLCGDMFSISAKVTHRTYIGVGEPPRITIQEETFLEELEQYQISFINVQLPEYIHLAREEKEQGTSYHREPIIYQVSPVFDCILDGQQRKQSKTLFACITAELGQYTFDPDIKSRELLCIMEDRLAGYTFDPDIMNLTRIYSELLKMNQHILNRMV